MMFAIVISNGCTYYKNPFYIALLRFTFTFTARRSNEIKELEHEQLIMKTIQVKIKNVESDIASADEQLVLEEGPLMKHTRSVNLVVVVLLH